MVMASLSIIHLLENNTYFTLFTCMQSSLYFFIENAFSFTLLFCCIAVMASFWNNRSKRREFERGYIIAMVPFAAPAAKGTTNASSSGVPRLLLVCVVVFMVA